ncbi:MAG: sulfate adenylyltransferase subunit CysD, partial [Candidatus Scalindua sp.]
AFGGARREEEKSRAKERVFSFRDEFGQWDPKYQRPELWNLYNCRINEGESIRVFPLSNWTELDIWQYLKIEKIPIVPIYYSQEREVIDRNGVLVPYNDMANLKPGEKVEKVMCRFRSLGCMPCTGAVRSRATTIDEIITEIEEASKSERENRIIDHGTDSSMEDKKKEGYF